MHMSLNQIESAYSSEILQLANRTELTVTNMLEFSEELFQKYKVKGISDSGNTESDMLLYQYGVYNWGDELGEHFTFDITRQFIAPKDDEPYQLHFELIFEPDSFRGIKNYDCWSCDYPNIENFFNHIKTTQGFHAAEKITPKKFQIQFDQC